MVGRSSSCSRKRPARSILPSYNSRMKIYLIRNRLNGKCYVGQTSQKLERRLSNHRSVSKRGARQPLPAAIRKYGWDGFTVEVLEEAVDSPDLDMAERFWIRCYDSLAPNGYNLETGGHKLKTLSVEHRARIADSHRGRKLSDEHKAAISKPRSEETKVSVRLQRSHITKLDMTAAREIRRLRAEGEKIISLAALFDVSEGTICRVLSGECWAEPPTDSARLSPQTACAISYSQS